LTATLYMPEHLDLLTSNVFIRILEC